MTRVSARPDKRLLSPQFIVYHVPAPKLVASSSTAAVAVKPKPKAKPKAVVSDDESGNNPIKSKAKAPPARMAKNDSDESDFDMLVLAVQTSKKPFASPKSKPSKADPDFDDDDT